ncbi:MAG: hypothetical protein M3Q47_06200 [Actinomycetota bacterium]|nr:hypothetical protein [Actinomycetota bacterium]
MWRLIGLLLSQQRSIHADRDPEPGFAEAAPPTQPDVEMGLELLEPGGRAADVFPGGGRSS